MVTVFAPAKINLALHVTGQRPDGYHLMDMLVAFAATGDTVVVVPAGQDDFTISGPFAAAIPAGPDNLVLRARDMLRRAVGAPHCLPVAIHLVKNLPPASGMGGGSSDAAATLKALVRLWTLDRETIDLPGLAAALGADVPMCLAATPLRARGVGEIVEPLGAFPTVAAVLVNPGVEVPTPSVFRALTDRNKPSPPAFPSFAAPGDLAAYVNATRNDLQAPAVTLAPVIGDALAALGATAPLAFRMTGSGATCFGLYDSADAASRAAAFIRANHPDWYVEATTLNGV